LLLHGHGARRRILRGPKAVGGPPVESTTVVRRYQCKKCGGTVTVRPRGVLRRRLYGATAIGLGLALFGLEQQSAHAVREAIAPTASHQGPAEGATWSTLRRWAGEAKAGTLTEDGHACPATFTLRQAAERMATTLQALGRRVADALERVWEGALEALWRGAS
jgi:DNA-directed RNA polymerase subunit RPC12/RpoP